MDITIIPKEERVCCVCKKHTTYVDSRGWKQWYKHKCDKKDCTGYLCKQCWDKYDDDSSHSIIKGMTKSRLGQLTLYDTYGKGIIGAQTVANTLGVDDYSIIIDNFCYYVDLSKHSEYGYVEVKTMSLNVLHRQWVSGKIRHSNFDTLFLICMDQYEPWRNILEVYAIPRKNVGERIQITIRKDSSKTAQYDRFRIDKEPYNKTFHNLMEFLKCKEYFGIDDIKKWLEINKNKR